MTCSITFVVAVVVVMLVAQLSHAVPSSMPPFMTTNTLSNEAAFRISLTVSARLRNVEISWSDLPADQSGIVFVTTEMLPLNATFRRSSTTTAPKVDPEEHFYASTTTEKSARRQASSVWTTTGGIRVRYVLAINGSTAASGWQTSDLPFDFPKSTAEAVDEDECYGVWATFVPDDEDAADATITTTSSGRRRMPAPRRRLERQQTCMRWHPRWMNRLRPNIQSLRVHDLFLVGTHDSGSYRYGFDPRQNETRVSKYTLTQDDDVYAQLLLGVRYLDIRVGSYRTKRNPQSTGGGTNGGAGSGGGGGVHRQPPASSSSSTSSTATNNLEYDKHFGNQGRQFWVNHGISRLQPLDDVLRQVRDFVLATGEIVVFDVQEFPVGFDQESRHRALVYHLQTMLRDVLVAPHLTWGATLGDIWRSGGLVLLAYDHTSVAEEFSDVVFQAVRQRWGAVQTVTDLRRFLDPAHRDFVIETGRPFADMAEMTPTPWDVLTDKYNGLRTMADETNRQVSLWYDREWGADANIVAVDYVRGTTLMESSLRWNRMRCAVAVVPKVNESE